MQTSRTLLRRGERREQPNGENKWEDRLSEAWRAIQTGDGSREDFEVIMSDLAEQTEFFYVADPSASGEALLRREGRREIMSRILFLLDRPVSYMTELRRAALDELTITQIESS